MLSGVKVEGLAEFRRGLNRLDPELTKMLRGDLLEIGKDVARVAQGKVPSKSGLARGSIRAGVSGNNAYVAGGKANVPYYGWLDFGNRSAISGRPRSIGPWKGTGSGPQQGRFIYKAIAQESRSIETRAADAIKKAEAQAFND